jgi:hypothetical protein
MTPAPGQEHYTTRRGPGHVEREKCLSNRGARAVEARTVRDNFRH